MSWEPKHLTTPVVYFCGILSCGPNLMYCSSSDRILQ